MTELESGDIAFYTESPRLYFTLRPWNGGERVLVIGRKHIAQRFWALVAEKLAKNAEEIGAGEYRIYEHDGHGHLSYELDRHVDEAIRTAIDLGRSGGFIVTVMNPDPTLWTGNLQEELFPGYRAVPAPFPPYLQERFEGRKYARLDTVEYLDYLGAELVLIAE